MLLPLSEKKITPNFVPRVFWSSSSPLPSPPPTSFPGPSPWLGGKGPGNEVAPHPLLPLPSARLRPSPFHDNVPYCQPYNQFTHSVYLSSNLHGCRLLESRSPSPGACNLPISCNDVLTSKFIFRYAFPAKNYCIRLPPHRNLSE